LAITTEAKDRQEDLSKTDSAVIEKIRSWSKEVIRATEGVKYAQKWNQCAKMTRYIERLILDYCRELEFVRDENRKNIQVEYESKILQIESRSLAQKVSKMKGPTTRQDRLRSFYQAGTDELRAFEKEIASDEKRKSASLGRAREFAKKTLVEMEPFHEELKSIGSEQEEAAAKRRIATLTERLTEAENWATHCREALLFATKDDC
jgi:hypothetical protein